MFEIEKMEKEFDYSLVDNETADFLRSCEYEMKGIAEDARLKIGGVLLKARDKLANNKNGVFLKWVEDMGISQDDAYYYINLNISSRNLGSIQKDNFLKAPKSLQKEVMKKKSPVEAKQAVLEGDVKTLKEYKELVKRLDEAEQAKQQAEEQAKQLEQELQAEREKEPKVIVKENKFKLEQKEQEIERLYSEIELLKKKAALNEREAKEYDDLKKRISLLNQEKNGLEQEIESVTELSGLAVEIDHILKTKLSPVKYSRSLKQINNDVAVNNLSDIVTSVEQWCKEMRVYLPSRDRKTVEVIDVE